MLLNRAQSWMQQTHGPQFELVRHFLTQTLTTHLTSSEQARRYYIAVLALVGCLNPLIVRLYTDKYAYLRSQPDAALYLAAVRADRLFFITLSMAVAVLITTFQWQSLFPSHEDYLNLKPLPVRLSQVFLARFVSSLMVIALVNVVLNLAACILFPLLASARWQSPGFGLRTIFAHAIATIGAGFFVFFVLTALQGVCLNLLPARAFERASLLMQVLFVVVTVSAVPYVFDIPNWHLLIAARPHWLEWFPAAWFGGVYEVVLGSHDASFMRQAQLALLGSVAAFVTASVAYFGSYWHSVSSLREGSGRRHPRKSHRFLADPLEKVIRSPRELAVVDFVACALRRSRHHKLLVSLGVGAALVLSMQPLGPFLLHWRPGVEPEGWQLRAVLAAPIVMGAVVVSSLFYVFQLPLELRANWIFRTAESGGRLNFLNGVEKSLLLFGLLPVLLASFLVEVLAFGVLRALAYEFFAALFLLLLVELRLHEWHKIPFTCSYISGKRNLWQMVGAYFALFVAVIPTAVYFEAWLLRPLSLLLCSVLLCALYAFLRHARRRQWKLVPLLFDEAEEALIGAIHLARD